MYVNGKMRPVKTVPGMEGWGTKENSGGGGNSSVIYFLHCKNLCKCHNVPPPSITIKRKENTLETVLRTLVASGAPWVLIFFSFFN
jgi:hypothetical protein